MKIVLTAIEAADAQMWREFCGDFAGVTVHQGSVFEVACEAVVSPANSFGFMDGGIDYLYSRRFGWGVQERLQATIRAHHHGELLVGAAEIVSTEDEEIPFVIAAPTMRVPMVLRETVNPYLAARAALLMVKEGRFRAGEWAGAPIAERVRTVAFPGLGTGVGRVPFAVCAHQMRAALEDVLGGVIPYPRTWAEASTRHQMLYTSHARNLQRE